MITKIIPTNVITGFLGVGKTSFIKHLLRHKPATEVWAVLVNEFGEIGIDAGLLSGDAQQVQIKEVAGGCMCCAAGLPMQVAINQLIAKAKPDRLLIEPTGLGHPLEVLKVLTQAHYQQVLAMKACITLVDARKLDDSRYTQHDIFNQQLLVADIVLASKADCYEDSLLPQLSGYLGAIKLRASKTSPLNHPPVIIEPWSTAQAPQLLPAIYARLNQPYVPTAQLGHNQTYQAQSQQPNSLNAGDSPVRLIDVNYSALFSGEPQKKAVVFDASGLMCKTHQGDGYYSCGWVFDLCYEFDFDKLLQLIKRLAVVRLKAVMITDEGIAGFNAVEQDLSIIELDEAMDSRIEILSMSAIDQAEIEAALMQTCSRLTC
ncbi:CobW family GTP-binding protein [Shewanella youngdeokensis]|uniref:CobW family GTP-binding protein n=1 Tax=Shewanella youngdeokensis TaxID=2999068 RepID=A0ABZ0K0H4_9GAMM|nr:CobW family GTP-binding protein [Shewanella sp. DAU334]